MKSVSKILSCLLCVLLLLSPFTSVVSAQDGVIEIDSLADLDAIRNDLTAHYRLTADLTFTPADFAEGGAFYNDGAGWIPIGPKYKSEFKGDFDGNGHSITGLQINAVSTATDTSLYCGLFGISSGRIYDLTLKDAVIVANCPLHVYVGTLVGLSVGNVENIQIENTAITVPSGPICSRVGGVAGSSMSGSISFASTSGHLEISGVSPYVGGIVGDNNNATITQTYSRMSISTTASGDVYVGGIAGQNDGKIYSSLATGALSPTGDADGYVGGIAGINRNIVVDCLATGLQTPKVNSRQNFGGVIGTNAGAATACYYTYNSCPIDSDMDGVTSLQEADLTSKASFVGWNFDTDWTLDGINSPEYPLPQFVVRKELQTKLNAIVLPDDTLPYTADSVAALLKANTTARQLTPSHTVAQYISAIQSLQEALAGLTFKRLVCQTNGDGTVAVTGDTTYGETVTLNATPDEGQVFAGYIINRHFIREPVVDTFVNGVEDVVAYFRSEQECTVVFQGKYERVIDVQTVTATDQLVPPTPPVIQGRRFVGWKTDVAMLDLSAGLVYVDAVYEIDETTAQLFTLEVINGESNTDLTQEFAFDTRILLTPTEKENEVFSHWLVNGHLASVHPALTLFVAGNDRVEAVYNSEPPTLYQTSLQQVTVVPDGDRFIINAIAQIYAPEDATVLEYGVLFGPSEECLTNPDIFTLNSLDVPTLAVSASSTTPNRRYLIYLTHVPAGANRYLRSYTVFLNADGEREVIYSPVMAVVAA